MTNYTIITLGNPEREGHREQIHFFMDGHTYVENDTVNGKDPLELEWAEQLYDFKYRMSEWRPGELGLWYSNVNAWVECVDSGEDLIVFEDDAIPTDDFRWAVDNVPPPRGYDFVTYYTPERHSLQAARFTFAETGQEHGNICIRYSPQGAEKILELLETEGIEYPVDIWLFKQNKFRGTLKGYGPRSISAPIISHDFQVPTNIHNDERIYR